MSKSIGFLEKLRRYAVLGGGKDRIRLQHKKGKLTARERINDLVDSDSFQEIGLFASQEVNSSENGKSTAYGDGVITGKAEINGRPVYLFAQDFTVMGGSVGKIHGKKIARIIDLAIQNGAPLIGLNDSGGARIQEGRRALFRGPGRERRVGARSNRPRRRRIPRHFLRAASGRRRGPDYSSG